MAGAAPLRAPGKETPQRGAREGPVALRPCLTPARARYQPQSVDTFSWDWACGSDYLDAGKFRQRTRSASVQLGAQIRRPVCPHSHAHVAEEVENLQRAVRFVDEFISLHYHDAVFRAYP